MSYHQRETIERLKQEAVHQRLQCPKCNGNSDCVRGADYRFSSYGSPQLRKCRSCGHVFEYDDGWTG